METLFAWSAHQCPVFHGFILKDNAHPSDVKLGWVINTQAGLTPVLVLVKQHMADSACRVTAYYLNHFWLWNLYFRYLNLFNFGDFWNLGEQQAGSEHIKAVAPTLPIDDLGNAVERLCVPVADRVVKERQNLIAPVWLCGLTC